MPDGLVEPFAHILEVRDLPPGVGAALRPRILAALVSFQFDLKNFNTNAKKRRTYLGGKRGKGKVGAGLNL